MMKSTRIPENWRGTLTAWNYRNNIAGVINDLLAGAPDDVLADRLTRFSFLCRSVEYFLHGSSSGKVIRLSGGVENDKK